jgi:hypothetical protein
VPIGVGLRGGRLHLQIILHDYLIALIFNILVEERGELKRGGTTDK